MAKKQSPHNRSAYWRMVFQIARQSAWDRAGMKVLIPTLSFILLTGAITGILFIFGIVEYPFLRDNLLYNSIGGCVQVTGFVGVMAILFIFLLRDIPPRLYYEQQVTISQSRDAEAKLTEQARPKLELKYLDGHPSSVQIDRTGENTGTQFRVSLTNVSTTQSVENISISLVEVTTDPFSFLPAELGIMNNVPKRLNAGAQLFIDVVFVYATRSAGTETQFDFGFNFIDEGLKARQRNILRQLRTLEFIIKVTGTPQSSEVSKPFVFSVSGTDGEPKIGR